ncbi:nuclear transport factor 2 family protein [Parahaliea sp. F7430]|uniref:Nuclear transport factor 2 family protein n=1 Tax=Sediminihaliea albiluteola TaxID=2758564 RepID=A0A7W2YKS8_9GAMM|nr:nuclear transport factor 2 family protein [Sediminihaliea albiluteola]MBA6413673.1 nuclear transport factor 2 family protein [Sediminihaliea albiluteola]
MNNKAASKRPVLNKDYMGIKPGIPLQVSATTIEALSADVQRLMDIEAIKQLKYAYFRCVDTANIEELATLYHDDIAVHFLGGSYEWKIKGKQELLDKQRDAFHKQAVGQHNGHHPEIQLLSDSEATGLWYLADNMWSLNMKAFTTGTAIYWDTYKKVNGKWLIIESKYERLYEINEILDENPKLASHYLADHGVDLSR